MNGLLACTDRDIVPSDEAAQGKVSRDERDLLPGKNRGWERREKEKKNVQPPRRYCTINRVYLEGGNNCIPHSGLPRFNVGALRPQGLGHSSPKGEKPEC